MAVKNYLINDKWLDIDKQNIVEVKSTDGIIGSIKLNGEEYGGSGGGGESDFSTVTVTVVDSNTGYISSSRYIIPYITENDGVGTTIVYAEDESYDLIVPLYKGKGTFMGIPENIVVSGDANFDENTHTVHIFGNCSIKGWQ